MERFAAARPGTEAAAWGLYQAALAARAAGDPAGAARLRERLRREHPGHRLALRLRPDPAPSPRAPRPADCGPRALLFLCRRFGLPPTLDDLRRDCGTDRHGTTLEGLRRGARAAGLSAEALQVDAAFLRRRRPAGIARVDGDHYVAFLPGPGRDTFLLHDPGRGEGGQVTADALVERCRGIVLLLAPRSSARSGTAADPRRRP